MSIPAAKTDKIVNKFTKKLLAKGILNKIKLKPKTVQKVLESDSNLQMPNKPINSLPTLSLVNKDKSGVFKKLPAPKFKNSSKFSSSTMLSQYKAYVFDFIIFVLEKKRFRLNQ